MSLRTLRTHVIAPVALGVLAVSLLAAPAAAGSTTIWVDGDGAAGPSGCGGGASAPETIQEGLDAAAPGDTVKVCPGTYREYLDLDKNRVILTAVTPWTAVVRPPSPPTAGRRPAGDPPLVRVSGDRVTVRWLKVVVPSTPGCPAAEGIVASGVEDVTIRGNRIRGGSGDGSIVCGLSVGIEVTDSSGLVAWNSIRNYRSAGIRVFGAERMKLFRNSIHWAHTGTACAGACTGGRLAGDGPSQPAIVVENATATIERNHVEVDGEAGFAAQGGITIYASDIDIDENTVIGFDYGITAAFGTDGRIRRNTVRRGDDIGIYLYENAPGTSSFVPEIVVRGNRVRGFDGYGMSLSGAPYNLIRGNDFTKNPGIDCHDASDPTQSTWLENLGAESDPAGLCTSPA